MPGEIPNYGNPHVTPQRWSDAQYGAALYLFTREARAFRYVTGDGIDKDGLLRACRAWSTSEAIIIKVAMELFDPGCVRSSGYGDATVGEIVSWLDATSFIAVVNAMQIARGEKSAIEVLAAERSRRG
jgi:hypothetical protein